MTIIATVRPTIKTKLSTLRERVRAYFFDAMFVDESGTGGLVPMTSVRTIHRERRLRPRTLAQGSFLGKLRRPEAKPQHELF